MKVQLSYLQLLLICDIIPKLATNEPDSDCLSHLDRSAFCLKEGTAMKKTLMMMLVLVMLLSLCACSDGPETVETVNPACAAGHTWTDATCDMPKTCSVCAATEGTAIGHDWKDGVCTVCGKEDPGYDPLMDGVWLLIDKQKWNLFSFQPDGTCDVMNIYGRPTADYDMAQCVQTAVASLKKQYGENWELQAQSRFHVVKIFDYYYVAELTSRTEEFSIEGDLITVGNIPPVSYLIIISDNVLESGENDSRFSKVDFTYYSNLLTEYNKLQ